MRHPALAPFVGGMLLAIPPAHAHAGPFADSVWSFDPGLTPTPDFADPNAALGAPERFTGESSPFPGVVSPFNPAFGSDELFSIGEGGHLTLRFDEPIRDDPANPFGIDLILFGNGGFIDADYPNGTTLPNAAAFGLDTVRISVSADGSTFLPLGDFTEGLFPAMGFADAGAFDTAPGSVRTDFTKAVNPALTQPDFASKTLAEIAALYDGSAGGTPIDLAASGLAEVFFVRLEVPDDNDPNTALNAEIDALVRAPAPGTLTLLGLSALGITRRRRP